MKLGASLHFEFWFICFVLMTLRLDSAKATGNVPPLEGTNVSRNITATVKDESVAEIFGDRSWSVHHSETTYASDSANISFLLKGKFLGWTQVEISSDNGVGQTETSFLPVTVVRQRTALDAAFLFSVIGLVCLAYMNMGCKLDFQVIKDVIKRPSAIAVGLVSQYVYMPLVAFAFSYLFLGNPGLRLSLFVTACCPGGGASNMWALLLGGNLNLSVTLTFFSALFAFVVLPGWIFSLGRVIFEVEGLRVPYGNVGTLVIGLVVPVSIGLLIKKCFPNAAWQLGRVIKPLFAFIILYIITFGIYTNLYIFRLLTWKILLVSIGLIWGGFLVGTLAGVIARFPLEDSIVLGLETGIKNSGVAIVLLRVSLHQPEADISLVFPIMADIVMAIPPTIVWFSLNYVCKSWKPFSRKKPADAWPLPRIYATDESDSDDEEASDETLFMKKDFYAEPHYQAIQKK